MTSAYQTTTTVNRWAMTEREKGIFGTHLSYKAWQKGDGGEMNQAS